MPGFYPFLYPYRFLLKRVQLILLHTIGNQPKAQRPNATQRWKLSPPRLPRGDNSHWHRCPQWHFSKGCPRPAASEPLICSLARKLSEPQPRPPEALGFGGLGNCRRFFWKLKFQNYHSRGKEKHEGIRLNPHESRSPFSQKQLLVLFFFFLESRSVPLHPSSGLMWGEIRFEKFPGQQTAAINNHMNNQDPLLLLGHNSKLCLKHQWNPGVITWLRVSMGWDELLQKIKVRCDL